MICLEIKKNWTTNVITVLLNSFIETFNIFIDIFALFEQNYFTKFNGYVNKKERDYIKNSFEELKRYLI